jgi:hypothetical protein
MRVLALLSLFLVGASAFGMLLEVVPSHACWRPMERFRFMSHEARPALLMLPCSIHDGTLQGDKVLALI